MGGELGEAPVSLWKQETAGTQACCKGGERLRPPDLVNALNIIAWASPGGSLGLAGAGSLHTSPKPTTGQSSD